MNAKTWETIFAKYIDALKVNLPNVRAALIANVVYAAKCNGATAHQLDLLK